MKIVLCLAKITIVKLLNKTVNCYTNDMQKCLQNLNKRYKLKFYANDS